MTGPIVAAIVTTIIVVIADMADIAAIIVMTGAATAITTAAKRPCALRIIAECFDFDGKARQGGACGLR